MKKVFVSGCYDILHAGHVQFFTDARALGDELTVCFASADVLWVHKKRRSSLPDEHKRVILESLSMVDRVVIGTGEKLGLDFEEHFLQLKPDILAVTQDDEYGDLKRELCSRVGAEYRVLEKTPPEFQPISSSELVRFIRAPAQVPLRVDFAGGWLDIPSLARPGAYVVNCAISPFVSLQNWRYEPKSGLGGSGAYALLQGDDGVGAELDLGVGWQDPAVIRETGLCVWQSGAEPVLEFKRNGDMLDGRMALLWTGSSHDTPSLTGVTRDYDKVEKAGAIARRAVLEESIDDLARAVQCSYEVQLAEGMEPLPPVAWALAQKYCGGGWGGYAVYLFASRKDRDTFVAEKDTLAIEPYLRPSF
jgi:cytidyltransferase-like protein